MSLATFLSDGVIVTMMDEVRDICAAANSVRAKNNIRNRQVLSNLDIISSKGKYSYLAYEPSLVKAIKDECNVKTITLISDGMKVVL